MVAFSIMRAPTTYRDCLFRVTTLKVNLTGCGMNLMVTSHHMLPMLAYIWNEVDYLHHMLPCLHIYSFIKPGEWWPNVALIRCWLLKTLLTLFGWRLIHKLFVWETSKRNQSLCWETCDMNHYNMHTIEYIFVIWILSIGMNVCWLDISILSIRMNVCLEIKTPESTLRPVG